MATNNRRSVERRALNTFTKLMRAVDSLRSRLEPILTSHGLTAAQFGVLEALLHKGPLNQHEVGHKLLVSKGNVTMVARNLERDGLITRTIDAQDRRRTILALTPRGRRVIEKAFPKQAAGIARELAVLSAEEQETLGRLCRALGLGIPDAGG
ncbi:MAG: MarR family winged helix-turn-helix transcriptional regulator [Longimicrobiales bacterium]